MGIATAIERVSGQNWQASSLEEDVKRFSGEEQVEQPDTVSQNLVYDNTEEEPALHLRTYFALAAMWLLTYVQVMALIGPPAVLSYIGTDLKNPATQTWVPNSLSLVQAVICPLICSASDIFQARKLLLVGSCIISFIGAAIAPGSQNIYRLIVSQILVGIGFAAVPLAYVVPSEILPRKWRPMAQAFINVAAALGAMSGPLIIGGFTNADAANGWRNFYWIQMGLWGASAIGILLGYRPPKRHTRLDHLSTWQKLGQLDLHGLALLTTGLTLFLVGLNLGGNLYSWTNARTLATLIAGLVILVCFCLYEWKGTTTGIVHHELFRGGKSRGRTFALCVALLSIEAAMLFTYIIFYPVLTTALYEKNPLKLVGRQQPFWIACGTTTLMWGWWSARFRTIRAPLVLGYVIFTGGLIGSATLQPDDSTKALIFAGLTGIGFGAPLVVIIAGVQLATPHELIATATALTTSARAVAATIFTAVYAAAFTECSKQKVPAYVSRAVMKDGLPQTSAKAFVEALVNEDPSALPNIPYVTPKILAAGVMAFKQAFADSIRVVYFIAIPFGALAMVMACFLGDLKETMNYRVDAPIENLNAKQHQHSNA